MGLCVQVVVMTHAYGDCGGVRYLTNGLKVHHCHINIHIAHVNAAATTLSTCSFVGSVM